MRTLAAVALTGALLTLVAACAAAPPVADPKGPYAHGEQLYRGHCAACHRLRDPRSQTRARWAWAVEKFGPRAKLSPEERAEVLAFLQAYAKDATPPAAAPATAPPASTPAPAPAPAPQVNP